jgi:hypothetical protein
MHAHTLLLTGPARGRRTTTRRGWRASRSPRWRRPGRCRWTRRARTRRRGCRSGSGCTVGQCRRRWWARRCALVRAPRCAVELLRGVRGATGRSVTVRMSAFTVRMSAVTVRMSAVIVRSVTVRMRTVTVTDSALRRSSGSTARLASWMPASRQPERHSELGVQTSQC